MPYNLVVICLDTFRWDLLNHRGPVRVALPHLDALRADSVEFVEAFGEGQPTIPVRRAYFTGQRSFPWRFDYDTEGLWPTGRGWHKIPPEQQTLAEILLNHGYQTGLVSDTYHMFKPTMNFTRGFLAYEFIRGYESDNYRSGRLPVGALQSFVRDPEPHKHPILTQYLLNIRDRQREEQWLTARVFRRAMQWVRDHREAQPFMLWVDSFAPHEPWDPPRSYVDSIDGLYEGIEFIYPAGLQTNDLSSAEAQRVQHLYLGYLAFVDTWVGKLLTSLQTAGVWDRTIVVLLSDHGTELLDHGRFGKYPSHLFRHNTQIVWTIRHPQHPGRQEVASLVQSHDVFPTLLSCLNIEYQTVDGRNVWIEGNQGREQDRPWIVSGWDNYASVRDKEWNYIVNFEDPEADERLYELISDPGEQRDVAAMHPETVRIMREHLEGFLGQKLPAWLPDTVRPGIAPVSRYYQALNLRD